MRAESRPDTTSAGLNALSDLINDDWGETSYRARLDAGSKADFVEQFARNVSISSRDVRAKRDDGYSGSKARPLERRKGSPLTSRIAPATRKMADALTRAIQPSTRIPSNALSQSTRSPASKKAASRSVSQAKLSPKERVSKARQIQNCQPRPEPNKTKQRSGKSGAKTDFIPWCDHGKR